MSAVSSSRGQSGAPSPAGIARRRLVFAMLAGLSFAGLAVLMFAAMRRGGVLPVEGVMLALFLVTLPWLVIGFWNAAIGLLLMRFSRDPAVAVNPMLADDVRDTPLETSTAILVCLRNEEIDGVALSVETMLEGLLREGALAHFHLYLLSDSSWPEIIADEERLARSLQARWGGDVGVTYRRRENNHAFKSGNISDFCQRWGQGHDFALVLDADSFMEAPAILRLVRLMQRHERVGILQSLVVGLPTMSAFARIFQFGMRLGMRSYTLGSAWWQGDCGPYWGHNALLRLKPFTEHCHLPELGGKGPLSGPILSHDQVEAVMMRRAGYEVRVLPVEGGSFEQNPPDLVEFIRRDLRWCHGNMQYLKLLAMKGLRPVSRMQLVLAILMFVGSPAWVAFMVLSAGLFLFYDDYLGQFDPVLGATLFASVMTMVFAPKFATVADILVTRERRQAFGGALRIVAGVAGEVVISMLLAPVMAIAHTVFLAKLALGRGGTWSAQARQLHTVPYASAVRRLWPQTLFGAAGLAWFADVSALAVLPALPVVLGPLLAIPFTRITASPFWGRVALASGLWRIPEETEPASDLLRLGLPALPSAEPQALYGEAAYAEAPAAE
ncbi:glucans biosynthesis glucosyltransferase MdoH [Breoghania sp.]|uniref:glucans biosynthesis glucosyltransferase MdoH n=1 Tax=Breoghania sp. TaxID=2065378 RepID=UPI002AA5E6F1|nr:glucans biosynthesis glucosyltransferase MdoH [Breoghania sp.]